MDEQSDTGHLTRVTGQRHSFCVSFDHSVACSVASVASVSTYTSPGEKRVLLSRLFLRIPRRARSVGCECSQFYTASARWSPECSLFIVGKHPRRSHSGLERVSTGFQATGTDGVVATESVGHCGGVYRRLGGGQWGGGGSGGQETEGGNGRDRARGGVNLEGAQRC